jgi:hypothetical protein
LVEVYLQCFRTCLLGLISDPEDGDSTFLRNVGVLSDYAASYSTSFTKKIVSLMNPKNIADLFRITLYMLDSFLL